MANPILNKRSSVPGKVPGTGDLQHGELAINFADGVLYYKTASNTISTMLPVIPGAVSAGVPFITAGNTLTTNAGLTFNSASGNIAATGFVGTHYGTGQFSTVSSANGFFWSGNSAPYAPPAATADTLSTARTISLTGDVTYTSGAFNGAANVTGTATLANSGVVAGTYGSLTDIPVLVIDAKGRIASAANVAITIGAGTLTLATSGIATGSQTFGANQTTNTTFTVNVPGTDIAEGTRTTTAVPITSSTGTNTTLSAASTTLAGVMTSADKTKLDGIAAGAQVNVATNLTYTTATTTGTVNSSTGINATIPAATTSLAGLMTNADKTKLDGIATGAQVNTVTTVAGKTGVVTLVKADVGLDSVDNTADSAKSVASAAVLTTARTIGGVSFNGSAAINLPGVNATGNQNTTGSAATLTTGRTIALTGDVTYTSGAFNGAANVTGTATLASVGTAGTYTKVTTDAKGRVTSGTTLAAGDIPGLDAAKITSGLIDAARLPSFVDDVLEFTNLAAFPVTGETGKLYVALDTNKVYRWGGTVYIFITSGAVDSVAGKTGVVTLVKEDVGLGSVDNTADSAKSVASAAILTTARTIGGVSFNGSAAINLPGVNATGNQNTTGSAATLTTARTLTIGATGKTFNGSANVAWSLAEIGAYDATNPAGYTTNTGTVTGVTGTAPIISSGGTAPAISISAATTAAAGSMSSADKTKLDGIAAGAQVNVATNLGITAGTTAGPIVTSSTGTNVTLPTASATASGVVTTGAQTWAGVKTFNSTITGAVSGNAGTATTLQTTRSIALSGAATGTATNFNGSANITIPVTGLNATNLNAGTVPDARITGTYSGITLQTNGGNTHVTTPNSGSPSLNDRTVFGLAQFKSDASAAVGAIVFNAPDTTSTIMHRLRIEGMIYAGGPTVLTIIQGYRTTGAWSNTSKINLGITDLQVRFGVTPGGNNCIILGDVGTTWSYPMLAITHAMFSHSGVTDAYCKDWTVGLITDLTGYTNVTTNLATTAINSSVSGNAATATTLQTARAINGVNFNGSTNITVADNTKLPLAGGSLTGSLILTATSTSIRQNSTAAWSGNPGSGVGKLEYHANRWYIVAGSNSDRVVQFRRDGSDVAHVDNTGIYVGTATSARYADLAEKYTSDLTYVAGTVVVFGGDAEVTVSTHDHDTAVAGIVSTNPAYLMNSDESGVAVALTGKVPCRVRGPVRKGQVLVTGIDPGTAQALDHDKFAPGCVLGKAMMAITDSDIHTINVAVGRF